MRFLSQLASSKKFCVRSISKIWQNSENMQKHNLPKPNYGAIFMNERVYKIERSKVLVNK